MPYTPDVVEELKLLSRFNLDTTQEGIKVHSTAEPEIIAATERLFDKGLVTQRDGGYLTVLGRTASEHAQDLLRILEVHAD